MSTLTRRIVSWVTVVLIAHVTLAAAPFCDPSVLKRIIETGTPEQLTALKKLTGRIDTINDGTVVEAWNRVAHEAMDVMDPNAVTEVTVHTWVQLTVNTAGTDQEMAAVIRALDSLRQGPGEPLFKGIITKTGVGDQSTAWIVSAAKGNRGHLYEVVGTRNLLDAGVVRRDKVVGMGIRIQRPPPANTHLLEGDLVEELANGKHRFFDFKANGGNYDLPELERAREAVLTDAVGEVVFVRETGSAPTNSSWLPRLQEINAELAAAGKPTIKYIEGGTLP